MCFGRLCFSDECVSWKDVFPYDLFLAKAAKGKGRGGMVWVFLGRCFLWNVFSDECVFVGCVSRKSAKGKGREGLV